MTELVANPKTGEALDLTKPTNELALFFDQIHELFLLAKSAQNAIEDELLRRMDQDNAVELDAGEFVVSAEKPSTIKEWQKPETIEALKELLAELVNEGLISPVAAREAVPPQLSFKVNTFKVKDLARRYPDIEERVEECVPSRPASRRMKVRRKDG